MDPRIRVFVKVLIVIPAHNEEGVIVQNLERMFDMFPRILSAYDWHVLVAENGSSDATTSVVRNLLPTHPRLELLNLTSRGKGKAIRTAWTAREADLFAFMDADLSADLSDLPRLLEALSDADIAVGSRWYPGAIVERSKTRAALSFTYNTIARLTLSLPVQDFQCGFKAVRQHVVRDLLSKTTHDGFFFDTELLALAHHEDYRVIEIPITWTESPTPGRQSKVKLGSTAFELLHNLLELRGRLHRMRKNDLVQ